MGCQWAIAGEMFPACAVGVGRIAEADDYVGGKMSVFNYARDGAAGVASVEGEVWFAGDELGVVDVVELFAVGGDVVVVVEEAMGDRVLACEP